MNKNHILISILIIITLSNPLSAKKDSGTNILLYGSSAISLGRGGTGVSSLGADLFYLNPASIAASERIDIGLQYGTIDLDYTDTNISAAVPTSYGVIGASLRFLNISSNPNDIEKGFLINLGGAKNFTDRLMMGASLNLFYGSDSSDNLNYIGISLGSIYNINFQKSISGGFGLFKPHAGLTINLGIPSGKNDDFADLNQISAGYDFLFYRSKKIDIGFFNEITAIHKYEDLPVKFGLESIFHNRYIARAGFTIPQSYKYGDYTLGFGYRFKHDKFDSDINYSLVHYSGIDFIHYLGLNLRYGDLDRESPATEIIATEKYISPNYDGRQDFVFFNLKVSDKSRIKDWKLQIANSKKEIVREFRSSKREIDEDFNLENLVKKIWQKKESMVVPETILWDGTSSRGTNAPDGTYRYSFVVWDERDNISKAKTGVIYIDNTPPKVKLKTDYVLFSPNGDDQKDNLIIELDISTSVDDEWMGFLKNTKGEIIKSYKWKGDNIPEKIIWNGKDDNDEDASEGLYNFFIESQDKAGNRTQLIKKGISLTRKYESADITSSNEYFSYNKHNSINFFTHLSNSKGLLKWKITIENENREIIRSIEKMGKLSKLITWNALDDKGDKLIDGKYYFQLSTEFDSGNTPDSFKKEIIFDSSPPEISLKYTPSLFSPDSDGKNDILTISPKANDRFGVKEWNIVIYSPSGDPFKTFHGRFDPAEQIKWDGIGDDNQLVESAVEYYIEFSATDTTGNLSINKGIKLPIDVLVVVSEHGLKIMISNIEFIINSADLKGKEPPSLNRVATILKKYNNYNVLIEGHTCDQGDEDYNRKLSEDRSKAVMEYLISKGIESNRLTYKGIGEISPFLPNTNPDNRRRNRRVEFILIKK